MKSSQARMKSSAFASDEIKSASPNPTKSDFIAKRFHPTQVGFLPPSADLVEKSTHCLSRQMCAFFWRRRRDSLAALRRCTSKTQSPCSMPVAILLVLSLAFARFIAIQARSQRSLSRARAFNFLFQQNKRTPYGVLLFWRRRRDLNSRAGYFRPTPLAGAPLRPT